MDFNYVFTNLFKILVLMWLKMVILKVGPSVYKEALDNFTLK
jgi:hypothetical protein